MSTKSITIIGAGIAGAAVAQCLERRGICATLRLYERWETTSSNRYGMTLFPEAYKPLLNSWSSKHISEADFRSCIEVDHIAQIGESPSEIPSLEPRSSSIRAHRRRLEELLRAGLDVQWDHEVMKVMPRPDKGGIELHFSNGKTLHSDYTIAADGEHSVIRQALAPRSNLVVLPYVAYSGQRQVKADEFQAKYAAYFAHSQIISTQAKTARFQLEVIKDDLSASSLIRYLYSRPSHGQYDRLHQSLRRTSDAFSIPEKMYEEFAKVHAELEQPFKELFDPKRARKGRIMHWLLRKVVLDPTDIENLSRSGVVLVGNAAHAEPILGGWGANAALLDAVALTEHIKSHGTERIADFYHQNLDRWSFDVATAEQRVADMHRSSQELSQG